MIKERFHSLDSLRGLASLQVVIAHCLMTIPALNWMVYQHGILKISFSIYLIHSVLIVVLIYLLKAYLSPYVIAVMSFIASFPVAMLFYYCVEVPSLNWANQFSAYVVKRFNLT